MSYDLYVELGGETTKDVDAIVNGNHRGIAIPDVFERIRLLAGVAARDEGGDKGAKVKDFAVSGDRKQGGGYKKLVHAPKPEDTPYAQKLIRPALEQLQRLHLVHPLYPIYKPSLPAPGSCNLSSPSPSPG